MKLMRAGQVVNRLTRALAALLASPRGTGEWSEHSVEALRKLVRARQAALLLATAHEQRVFGDQGAGAALRQLLGTRTAGAPPHGGGASDAGAGRLPGDGAMDAAPASIAVPAAEPDRVAAVAVLSVLADRNAVVGVYCAFARPISGRAASARLAVLNVVRPALEAAARDRLFRRRELDAVRRTLRSFPTGAALLTADGTLVDANNAAASLLAAERGDGPVYRGMVRVALTTRLAAGEDEPIVVQTTAGHVRLRGCAVGNLSSGASSDVLVVVEPVAMPGAEPSLVPDVELLRERFHLTEREQEVARLLCLGQSNVAIAEALGISPNTARHHTERVLMKLDIRSRAAIHRVLLETQRDMGSAPPPADRREAGVVALPRGAGYRSGTYGANGSHISRAD